MPFSIVYFFKNVYHTFQCPSKATRAPYNNDRSDLYFLNDAFNPSYRTTAMEILKKPNTLKASKNILN